MTHNSSRSETASGAADLFRSHERRYSCPRDSLLSSAFQLPKFTCRAAETRGPAARPFTVTAKAKDLKVGQALRVLRHPAHPRQLEFSTSVVTPETHVLLSVALATNHSNHRRRSNPLLLQRLIFGANANTFSGAVQAWRTCAAYFLGNRLIITHTSAIAFAVLRRPDDTS